MPLCWRLVEFCCCSPTNKKKSEDDNVQRLSTESKRTNPSESAAGSLPSECYPIVAIETNSEVIHIGWFRHGFWSPIQPRWPENTSISLESIFLESGVWIARYTEALVCTLFNKMEYHTNHFFPKYSICFITLDSSRKYFCIILK
jgi:hypothetical protein